MGGGNGEAMPAPVVTLQNEQFRQWNEFSGRLEAVDMVEVQPQVSGTITKIFFEEGSQVEKGQELFLIDPRPYEAALARAEADLASARSQASLAKVELDRAKSLMQQEFLSKSVFDQRQSGYRVANSSIQSAEAAVKTAKLNLEYAHVKAPISGRVGRAEITEGNVVESGPNAPVLTTIVASENIYAEFDVDEQTYLQMVRYKQDKGADMPVKLKLSSDETAKYEGTIRSFDNQLDTTSGTIRARAIFKNDDGALVPGMYATVRLGSAEEKDALRVSERAIGVDQDRRYVYVVNDENKIEYRAVKLGAKEDGKRIILSGLEAGERIIPSGLQRFRPGMEVQPMDPNAAPQQDLQKPEAS